MRQHLLLRHPALRILFLSETPPGSVHDQRLAAPTPYPLPTGSQLRQEVGLQAFTHVGRRGQPPTHEEAAWARVDAGPASAASEAGSAARPP